MLPDQILLFRKAIEAHCAETGESAEKAIRDTIIHEVGHHFGFSEEELEELGLE
jgi:predicted Zn-dependent protease with MMP-like domain